MANAKVKIENNILTLSIDDKPYRFHSFWLRDNGWDPETRSQSNGQRLITLNDIPRETKIIAAEIMSEFVHITFDPEHKTIIYNISWLLENCYDKPQSATRGWLNSNTETWDRTLTEILPLVKFDDVQSNPQALKSWLDQVIRYGFSKLSKGPILDQALLTVVDLFGFVRETNYGRYFDVRTEVNPSNLAYTGLGLQAHTDNPYRDPVPTLQVLYCLESSAQGGENIVVDGFRAVEMLRNENHEWFDVLSQHNARFEYAGETGTRLQAHRPIIELAPDGELLAVRFNNRSAAAITGVPFEKMEIYYDAYRRLGEIIEDPQLQTIFRLEPGECFIVNNTRILHGRKAYSGTGTRWLQGCYADVDGLKSKLATLSQLSC